VRKLAVAAARILQVWCRALTSLPAVSAAEPRPRRARLLALVIAAVVLVPRLAVESVRCARELGPQLEAARRFVIETPDQLIQAASGLSPQLVAALRERAPADARVVVFSSLPDPVVLKLLGDTFERLKNLVWPRPYDVRYARRTDDAAATMSAGDEGRLVVVDMAANLLPRPELPGRYELLYQDQLLRLWLLREVAR
jgi:hypothetical protein